MYLLWLNSRAGPRIGPLRLRWLLVQEVGVCVLLRLPVLFEAGEQASHFVSWREKGDGVLFFLRMLKNARGDETFECKPFGEGRKPFGEARNERMN